MNILITNRCNGTCQYCFLKGELAKENDTGKEITLENFKLILKYAYHLITIGVTDSLNLMGGEPTLHRQFHEIFKMALTYRPKNLNFIPIKIFSNGLFPPKTAKLFRSEACPVMINVNHHSNYSDSHWNLLEKNLSILSDSNLSDQVITLSLNIYKPGQNLEYMLDLATRYNIKNIRIDLSRPSTNRSNTFIDIKQIKEIIPSLLSFIKTCKGMGIATNTDCCLPLCSITNRQLKEFSENEVEPSFKCSGGIDVTHDLELWHCAPLRFLNLGKITDYASGKDIVEMIDRKTRYLRWNVESLDKCKNCKFLTLRICQGGCLSLKKFNPGLLESHYIAEKNDALTYN